ncbi:MAG: extracellular solute-binding protein, partial [Eubacteriales bacterium]|nr:extracellular solute-binding protein [Eubacteriales bacterium]
MKKILSVIFAVLLTVSMLLMGCSQTTPTSADGNSSKTKNPKKTDENVTLTVTISQKELGDLNIFKKYMDEHPGITINEQPVSANDVKLLAMISSGQAPDLIRITAFDDLPSYVTRGLLMPLDDYVNKSENIDLEDLYSVNSLFRFDGVERGQGPLYGIAKDWSFDNGIWINKNVFNSMGVEIPKLDTPYTYDQFAKVANQLTTKNGDKVVQSGLISVLPFPTLLELKLASEGNSIWNSDFTKLMLDQESVKNTVNYWMDLQTSGAMASPLYPVTDNIGYSYLINDKVGMIMCGYWMIGNLRIQGLNSEEVFDK